MTLACDTNILIYAFSLDPKAERARATLTSADTLSVQALNEFVHVARRKLHMDWSEVEGALGTVRAACSNILPIDVAVHARALALAPRYQLAFFDALMVAATLLGGCTTLFSEDMQHGLLVDGTLRIENPFASL